MSFMETGKKRNINNFVLAAAIILFAAVVAGIYSTGIFTSDQKFQHQENARVDYSLGNNNYTYSLENGEEIYVKTAEAEKNDLGKYSIKSEGESYSLVNEEGESYLLVLDNINADSAMLSADGNYILLKDGGNKLYSIRIRDGKPDSFVPIDEDVVMGRFTGKKNDIVYIKSDDSLSYSSGGYKNREENTVKKFQVSDSDMSVFYIRGEESGTLVMFNVGKKQEVDTEVYDISFSDGLLFYIKNYNVDKNAGELWYFNGKECVNTGLAAESFLG